MYTQALKRVCTQPSSTSYLASTRHARSLHSSVPTSSSATLPFTVLTNDSDASEAGPSSQSSPTYSSRLLVRQQKLDDLQDALSRRGNPSRVWAHYVNLLHFLGREQLPLDVHREVLRGCAPSSTSLREAHNRRALAGQKSYQSHLYEGRFQTIVRNIRKLGETPTLEDYHFILTQFAAVGHHTGSMQVYKEMVHLGVVPRTKTFGLCLHSIARRLALPSRIVQRPKLVTQTRKMTADLFKDMQTYQIPLTPVNFDLALRILKETADKEGFETLLKIGYGIDLSNPDCSPLTLDASKNLADVSQLASEAPTISPQPFSTASLNTTLEMLGRLGDVSQLVQSFEVLTQPLPPQAGQHRASSFDDDDDDFGVSMFPPQAPTLPPPSAEPNTTSYNILLKYLSRIGHASLARHYLIQAMELDRIVDRRLRGELMLKPMEEVLSPRFSLNRRMLLSVFGLANRRKNLELMRWLYYKIPKVLRRKQNDLAHYSKLKASSDGQNIPIPPISPPATSDPSPPESSLPTPAVDEPSPAASPSLPRAGFFTSSLNVDQTSQMDPSIWQPARDFPELKLDLNDSTQPTPGTPPVKHFDLDLHLFLIERDIEEIRAFQTHVAHVLERSTQRVKERLGRRVWNGRDVYLLTDDQRLQVPKKQWESIVRFKPPSGVGSGAKVGGRGKSRGITLPDPKRVSSPPADARSFSTVNVRLNASSVYPPPLPLTMMADEVPRERGAASGRGDASWSSSLRDVLYRFWS